MSGFDAGRWAVLVFVAASLISAVVLGFAYYLQEVKFLDPCPWCVVQRIVYLLIGALALVALLHGPMRAGAARYGLLGGVLALAGAAAALYQVWLQADPVRANSCTGSVVERILDRVALGDLWPAFLQYDGPCTLKAWSLFGLSIPEWSALWFCVLAVLLLSLLRARD